MYEASDGSDAVRLAQELNPDLILMDIGLPGLNGIEAARRIRELLPKSKIIFVTQERSEEIVQVALTLGGSGYVLKSRASNDLLSAIRAASNGRRFVSTGLDGLHPSEAEAPDTTD